MTNASYFPSHALTLSIHVQSFVKARNTFIQGRQKSRCNLYTSKPRYFDVYRSYERKAISSSERPDIQWRRCYCERSKWGREEGVIDTNAAFRYNLPNFRIRKSRQPNQKLPNEQPAKPMNRPSKSQTSLKHPRD
jgi:hypothetical protein